MHMVEGLGFRVNMAGVGLHAIQFPAIEASKLSTGLRLLLPVRACEARVDPREEVAQTSARRHGQLSREHRFHSCEHHVCELGHCGQS